MKNKKTNSAKKKASIRTRGQTRKNLLDAGLSLFSRHGFDGIAVRDLEEAVGLKPGSGSFYRHFSSKEELLGELMAREYDRARVSREFEKQALTSPSNDLRTGLRREFQLVLMGMQHREELINLLSREYKNFPDLMSDVRDELIDNARKEVANIYADRIATGELVQIEPIKLASVIHNALAGYHISKAFFADPPDGVDEESFIETLVTLVINK